MNDRKYFEEHIVEATIGMTLIGVVLGLAVYGLVRILKG